MELQKIVAENITRLRGNISRKELAQKSGVSYKHIYDIEEGLRNPSLDLIEKIAIALNVEPSSLLVNQFEKPETLDSSLDLIKKIASLDEDGLRIILGNIEMLSRPVQSKSKKKEV